MDAFIAGHWGQDNLSGSSSQNEADVSFSQNPVPPAVVELGVEMCDIFPTRTGTSAGIVLKWVLFGKPYC